VSDQLPPGLTFVSAVPTQGTYSDGTGEWNVATLNDGASATLILRARVDAFTPRTNTATITASGAQDTNPTNDSASATETPQLADLAVAKTVSNATPNVGDQITFTVTLTNNGPDAATNVMLEDLLPAGLTFVSATPSQGAYNSGTGVWNVGTVSSGTPQTLTITATVVSAAAATNVAAITGADQFDPDTNNNSASATETPQRTDLAIVKTVSDSMPHVGDQITYTLVVANTGPDTATGVTVLDLLPTGVTFVSASAGQGAYDNVTGIWDVGTVAFSATATLNITVTVAIPGQIENTATVDGDQFDPNDGNNSSSTTHRANAADLAIVKSVSDAQPDLGEQITYTLIVANTGPDTATQVVVTDSLPAGVTFVSAIASQGTYDNVSGIWTVGSIASAATATLTITVTVTSVTSVTAITNTATVTGDEFDPNTGNNTDSTSTDPQSADLALAKTVSNATPNVGEQITIDSYLAREMDLRPELRQYAVEARRGCVL
jgi:uncharacterized repeat protein (TIGR01451 family)